MYGILIVLLSPYLFYVFAQGVPGPINPSAAYSNDLLILFIPTQVFLIGGHIFDSTTASISNWGEMSGYLGPGLWLVVGLYAISKWRESIGKLLTLSFLMIALFSIGPLLHVKGTALMPMPWLLFSKLPLTNQALPGRFGMYIYLVAGLIAAVFFTETKLSTWLSVSLAILCVGFLVPDFSRVVITSTADAPAFCKSGAYKQYLAPKENVLFLPHGGESTSLLCQAESEFYYRLATADVGMTPPASAGWPILQSFNSNRAIIDSSEQLEAFLGANQVTSIVLEAQKKHSVAGLVGGAGT